MIDFHVDSFVDILATCDEHLPISDEFEREVPQKGGVWWTSQREHMMTWFHEQQLTGSGPYSRAEPNISAGRTYNRLLAPAALLWIAEALGEHPETVLIAADAARNVSARRRPGLIRRIIPWERIAVLASRRQGQHI